MISFPLPLARYFFNLKVQKNENFVVFTNFGALNPLASVIYFLSFFDFVLVLLLPSPTRLGLTGFI